MFTIHKFHLWETPGVQTIEMPAAARVLALGYQPGTGAMLWALVDLRNMIFGRKIGVCWTGQGVPPEVTSITPSLGTIQNPESGIVTHYFDLGY